MVIPEFTLPTVNIWFSEQTEPIYDPEDEESMTIFKEYWAREKERLIEGFNIDNVYVSGWLYWHTVYWKINTYLTLEVNQGGKLVKKKRRKLITPELRDIEWDTAEDFLKCEEFGKFYMLVGSRDFGKSIIAASRAGYLYTLFDRSESVISGAEKTYIKLATDKIEDGLTNLHPIFQKQRLANNWNTEVKAGWKDKETNKPDPKGSGCSIQIRNYEMGNKSMAANGCRPGFHLIDEIGTLPNFIGCIKDSEACWYSGDEDIDDEGNKPSCLTMYAGTGGDMDVGFEASEVFYAPEAYNILEFDDIWEGRGSIGKFIPATKAKMKYKEPKTLAEYLGVQSETLSKIIIKVSDEEKAKKEWWDIEYAKARKSRNQKALLKFLAYWPLKPSDAFLQLTQNDFNITAAQEQQARIKQLGSKKDASGEDISFIGTPVTLEHDGTKIIHKISSKFPISIWPFKTEGDPNAGDAPIMIYEYPITETPPFGLYVAGVDPYRHGKSEFSNSLGAVYIFKRIHNILTERYQYMFVASYVARPNDKEDWNNNARLLIKYYNALTLCENDEMSFIDYMVKKGDEMYLQPQPQWLKQIAPNTKVDRDFGIHMSNDRIRSHVFGLLKRYLDHTYRVKDDEKTGEKTEILGVHRVFDMMLLQEIIKFNFDGNFDRVIAAALAITLADHLDPLYKVSDTNEDERLKAYFARNKAKVIRGSSIVTSRRHSSRYRSGKIKMFT